MPKSDHLENMLLDTLFVNGTFSKPSTVYLALYTSNPTDADSGTELTGTGYSRLAIANNGTTFNRTGNTVTNAENLAFADRTGPAATVTHIGIRTAATGGNLLYHQSLPQAITVSANVPTSVTIAAGQLSISES